MGSIKRRAAKAKAPAVTKKRRAMPAAAAKPTAKKTAKVGAMPMPTKVADAAIQPRQSTGLYSDKWWAA